MAKKTVLVVDDSKTITKALKFKLEEQGYECLDAYSLTECKEHLKTRRHDINIALLDLNLPDAHPGEAVEFTNKFGIASVILTGSDISAFKELLKLDHVADYVIKEGQYSIEYALSLVNRLLHNKNKKVLIIEKDRELAHKISNNLRKQLLKTYVATNADDAEEVLMENADIAVVVTGNELDGTRDGLYLTKQIRKRHKKDEMVIIAIADSSKDIVKAAKDSSMFLKYGANDFLKKPFSNEELYSRINANLDNLDLFTEIHEKANRDFLTGMHNRRFFFETATDIYHLAKHNNSPLSLSILDIDHFKRINDDFGHDIGDMAIKEVAKILFKNLRKTDLAARFGGEEFCIIMPNCDADQAELINEQIRNAFEENRIDLDVYELKYTVSIGVCTTYEENLEKMIAKADDALYNSKQNGRNIVTIY
jgi:diguanylate cyclase (GGDEF)-like protein